MTDTQYFKSISGFIENISHGVIISNCDGNIICWNKAAETIFDYERSEAVGGNIHFILNEKAYQAFKMLAGSECPDDSQHGRWPGICKGGLRKWVDMRFSKFNERDSGKSFIITTVCDIQALKETERKLEESKARNEAILESSVDAIVTINRRGLIQSFNKAAQDMFGYSESEVAGENVSILMPPPHSLKHDDYIQNYIHSGEKKIIGRGREVQGLKKDGNVFPIDLSVGEAKWNGHLLFTGVIKDITNRKNLEKRILEISQQERQRIAQDLHDGLGQMLTGIRMISENLARKLDANSVPGADEVKEIADMIRETDEYARTLSHVMIEVDIDKKGLDAAFESLCKKNEKLFGIECKYEKTDDFFINDHNLALNLYRIAQEAIHNAVKHGEADKIILRLSKTGKHIAMVVIDNGKGFENSDTNTHEDKGMGIQIMKYRAGLFGGMVEMVRRNQKTLLRCVLPSESLKF